MAKAYVTKPTPTLPDITLELDGEEAMAVLSLTGRVGSTGPKRRAASRVWDAIQKIQAYSSQKPWDLKSNYFTDD